MMPFYSIQQLLDDFAGNIPEALIPERSLRPFKAWLRRWPAEIIAGFTFETRLGADQPQVDFSFNVKWPQRRQLATVAHPFIDNPIWARLYSLILYWNMPDHPLHDRLESIWFEFDGNAEHIQIPGLCFNAVENNLSPHPTPLWKHNPDLFFQQVFPLLTGQPLDDSVLSQVRWCIDQLPAEVEISYLCAMLSRTEYCPRLLLEGFSPDSLRAYLRRIHWSGDWRALDNLLEQHIATVDEVCIDIGEQVLPSIGIESRGVQSALKESERWKRILEPLVNDGLCTPEKAKGMISWLGASVGQLPFHHTTMYMWRIIDHLKFVIAADGALQTKAYLSWHSVEK